MMKPEQNWLDDVRVASPCKASWDNMSGDDRCRFCALCGKNVYNLSAMSKRDAENLVRQGEGKTCVRFYRRQDGTVLTDNCPVGLRLLRRPFQWLAAGSVALLAWGVAGWSSWAQNQAPLCPAPTAATPAIWTALMERFRPQPQVTTMGAVSYVPRPTPTAPPPPIMGEIAPSAQGK